MSLLLLLRNHAGSITVTKAQTAVARIARNGSNSQTATAKILTAGIYQPLSNPWEGEPLTGPLIDAIQNALVTITTKLVPNHLSLNGPSLYSGTGLPDNSVGIDGDFYFRKDGSTGTHIYAKSAGVWAGIA